MNLFQGLCARAREMLLVLLVFAIQVLSLTIFFFGFSIPLDRAHFVLDTV